MIDILLKKKVIRDFLSLFSDNKWPQLVTFTLEYGILMLKLKYNVASLSLEDISTFVDDLKENQNKREQKNISNIKTSTKSSEVKTPSESNSYYEIDKANKPKSKWRKGDDCVFTNKPRSTSNRNEKDSNRLETSSVSLKSDIYPKWWGEKKNIHSKKRKNYQNDSSKRKKSKHQRNQLQSSEITHSILNNESSSFASNHKNGRDEDKQIISHFVEKRFNKRKPSASPICKDNTTSRNKEESKIVMSFDMSSNNRFPYARNKNLLKNDSSVSKKMFSDNSEDKTPINRSRQLVKKTDSADIQIETKPINGKSRIKDHLDKDRKIFNMLKRNEMKNEPIFSSGEEDLRKIEDDRVQDEDTIPRTNYLLEYDKNLVVQNVREKSTEKQQLKDQGKHNSTKLINKAGDNQIYTTDNFKPNIKQYTSEKENNSFYQKFQDRSQLSDFNKDNQLTQNNISIVKTNNPHDYTKLDSGLHYNNLNTINNNTTKSIKQQYINTPSFNKEVDRIYSQKNTNRSEINESDLLSSYAPSERTKNLYKKGFKNEGFSEKNSYLSISQSIEYSKFPTQNNRDIYKPTIQNYEGKHYSSNDDDYINENDLNLY